MLPHLAYADDVHAALVEAGVPPELVSISANREIAERELIAIFSWDDVVLRWSSDAGWRHEAPQSGGPLPLDRVSSPVAVVAVVQSLVGGQPPIESNDRWGGAEYLELAISRWKQPHAASVR
ncbi:hypothetical protein [Streptomyces sp. NPDC099088]|uniref:hypothetical protein n=1 Tax=Streptomyces sp. NPDC099088 TaxID=3366101 RepID=UPI00381CC5AD